MDYLLKPISTPKLQKAINKITNFVKSNLPQNDKKIIAKYGQRLYLLNLDDIYYIEADLDEVIVRFDEGDGCVKRKISDMEKLLEGRNFFRIHRSCIVNVDKIKSIFYDFDVASIKIGMLYSNEIIDVVTEAIKDLRIPIVFDPVFVSKAGSKLLSDDGIENMKSLFPYSTVTTPNIHEAN